MKRTCHSLLLALAAFTLSASFVHAEILAMVNYETKPEQIVRKEGLAIIDVDDVDPKSPTFAKMLMDIPLPPDLVALLGEDDGHPSFKKLVSQGYQVITF